VNLQPEVERSPCFHGPQEFTILCCDFASIRHTAIAVVTVPAALLAIHCPLHLAVQRLLLEL